MLDDHGQPANPMFNASRRLDRGVHELLGMVKGVLADGVVNEAEAIAIDRWVKANRDLSAEWPVNVIAGRLNRIFQDLRVEADERKDLRELLERLVGGGYGVLGGANVATALPLDDPAPTVLFEGHTFVLTGMFALGPRRACERAVAANGGQCAPAITKATDYLVIGAFGSRDWLHTSFGNKIRKAVDYRDRGYGISIVSEDHWAAALP